MTTYSWTATGTSGDWTTATNWSPNSGPPGSADVAVFTNETSTYTANVGKSDTITVGTIDLNSTTSTTITLNISGGLTTGTLDYLTTGKHGATTIEINSGGVLDVTGSMISAASTVDQVINIAGTSAIALLELGSTTTPIKNVTDTFVNNAKGTINHGEIEVASGFTSGGTLSILSIGSIAWGDELIINGANFATGDKATLSSGTLTVKTSGGSTVYTIDNVGTASGTTGFAVSGNDIIAVCYARGTMIRTPDGELPVERLRAGEQVITVLDGEHVARPVKWLGHRRIDLTTHPRPETVAPIRILRGALADQMPHRDLLVSPDHAIFVDGKLICARQLINGTTILQETGWTAVDYFHVELDQHAILLAEGLPAESYIDTGNSGFFSNSDAPLMLHPDLTDESKYPTREAGSCAPFVWDEASVQPVWQRLVDRAVEIGKPVPQHATTTDAGLHLVAKGKTIKPMYCDGDLAIFALPRHATEVRLVSRAQSPTDARPWLEDRRKLGVRVARMVLRTADDLREIPVDHPALAKGWWAVEHDSAALSRWTNGDAVVPLPAIEGDALLEVHCAGCMIYLAQTDADPRRRAA